MAQKCVGQPCTPTDVVWKGRLVRNLPDRINNVRGSQKKFGSPLKGGVVSWHFMGGDKAMDPEPLGRLGAGGGVRAFVELKRRFQPFAFGSALALPRDFQQAEDVVQEAFLAAWTALPSLADP